MHVNGTTAHPRHEHAIAVLDALPMIAFGLTTYLCCAAVSRATAAVWTEVKGTAVLVRAIDHFVRRGGSHFAGSDWWLGPQVVRMQARRGQSKAVQATCGQHNATQTKQARTDLALVLDFGTMVGRRGKREERRERRREEKKIEISLLCVECCMLSPLCVLRRRATLTY
jgi:hypothetical protein